MPFCKKIHLTEQKAKLSVFFYLLILMILRKSGDFLLLFEKILTQHSKISYNKLIYYV